jgi:diguanylate cyclase (GGDEF)-like protein
MLDIDHFKLVNDRHGHLAGDHVLKTIGQILLLSCREVDFAARYGGEEFTLILPGIDAKEAWTAAENIRRKISEQQMAVSGRIFNVSVSIGCAFFPQDAQIASQLIRSADERLYRAKSMGRNRVIVS